jgi:hypothetical protein
MLFGGVACIAIGVCLMAWAAVQLWLARDSRKWPMTRGTIETAVVQRVNADSPRYAVAVSYAYEVGGTRYTGKRVHFGYAASGEEEDFAQARRRKYMAFREVTVRYSPDDPRESTLETETSRSGLAGTFLGGAVFIAFGVFMVRAS